MKKTNQNIIRWSTILFMLLAGSLLAYNIFFSKTTPFPNNEPHPQNQLTPSRDGTLSNETFSKLIEQNLSELGFIENISFVGKEDGYFSICGTFTSPERFSTLIGELSSLEVLLKALKNETISIEGHLGKNEIGNGCFVTDTITFSGYTVPAGIGTEYIEQYTGLNQLLAVPYEEIRFSEKGVFYENGLPAIIQTALYK